MTSSPLVSVIIPTYNRAALLPRALQSVVEQTYSNMEIIVVDDGSTDATENTLRQMGSQITLLQQSHQGVSRARNLGIESANGEWLAFLDSDDVWQLNKIEQQIKSLQNEPEYRIAHADEIWIRSGVRVNPMKKHSKKGGWIFQDCLSLCFISPSSVVIHRSVFDRIGGFDESLPACEDYDLWLRITALYPVLYLSAPLTIRYGGHSDQLSMAHWGMDRFRIQALTKLLRSATLTTDDKLAACAVLRQKLAIMIAGASKRRHTERVQYYEELLNTYC